MSTLIKTEGIVLDHVLYRETSAIVHMYTRHLGRQNYIVNGVRGQRKSSKTVLLQPLNRLWLEVYHNPRKEIHRIGEFALQKPLLRVPYFQNTRTQAFFITEFLSKMLTLQNSDNKLFDFLKQAVELLDTEVEGSENLHLYVMFKLTHYLGFFPNNNYTPSTKWFDLKNGEFLDHEPPYSQFLQPHETSLFVRLFNHDIYSFKEIALNSSERQIILNALLSFYQIHTHGLGQLKSLDVLHHLLHT